MTDHRRSKWGWIAWTLLAALAGAVCGVTPTPARGADESRAGNSKGDSPAPAIEPQADEVLRAAGKYLGDAKSFTFTADVWEDTVLAEGQKVKRQKTTKAGVRRPNGVYAETHNERVARGAWYDGKTLTIYNRQGNFYGTVDSPDTIDKMIEAVSDKFGIAMPLSDLLISDLYAGVTKNVTRGMYLGRQTVAGVRCHHLAFVQDDIDWEMWVEDGRAPVIRKYLITYKNDDKAPQFEATLSDWNFDAKLDDYAFTFRPPLGASKIEVLAANASAAAPADRQGDAQVAKDVQPADDQSDSPKSPDKKD
jgi:hypothetical protein